MRFDYSYDVNVRFIQKYKLSDFFKIIKKNVGHKAIKK